MCSILVQILVHRIVFAIFATIIGKPHGMRSILKLTLVNWMLFLRLSEAQTLQVDGIRNILKLSSAHCTYWHGVCCKIYKLHGGYHILKPKPANRAELAAV